MSYMFFLIILYIFSELQQSYQNEFNLQLNQQKLVKDIENEEFLITNEKYLSQLDKSEGSGLVEGSGFRPKTSLDFPDLNNCVETGYESICSNKGKCINNQCVCESAEFLVDDNSTVLYRYTGRYCEECPYCRAQRCQQYLPCIECNFFQKETDCNSYCQFTYKLVDKLSRNFDKDEKFCDIESTSGCYFKFKYFFNSGNLVEVEFEKDCLCFDGFKMIMFIFWGVVIYIFALIMLVPRLCPLGDNRQLNKSTTSLATRHDILRFNIGES